MPSSSEPTLTPATSLILVDGRSGSGKTHFATALAKQRDAVLISIDEVYPGWDGLDAGSWHIYHHVLVPISRGEPARYLRWDWQSNTPSGWVSVPSGAPVIVEGCGAIREESESLVAEKIWLEAPEEVRLARALERDGEEYAIAWRRWALQEERFMGIHASVQRADTFYYTG